MVRDPKTHGHPALEVRRGAFKGNVIFENLRGL